MKIAIIGVGVMGSSFARQLAGMGHEIVLCARHPKKLELLADEIRARVYVDPNEAVKGAELILLAVKPGEFETLASILKPHKNQLYISILSGITTEVLNALLAPAMVIRTMPNLALTVGETVMAIVNNPKITINQKNLLEDLFNPLGFLIWADESKINAIAALAGSGPAFVIAMIEAMIDGGISLGLKAQDAFELTTKTFKGAVALLEAHNGHPAEIRSKITVPNGTTIEGICAFEEAGVRSGIIKTLKATYNRSEEKH